MKTFISYPPLDTSKGCPTLGQNRQFQYFLEPTYIYPVVPASAATLLKQVGYSVVWNDCIAQGLSQEEFFGLIRKQNPDIIAFETKTPVVKQHWQIINKIKGQFSPATDASAGRSGTVPKIVLFGDHVTALPEESFQKSAVDFVLTGGDYDFLLLNLCNCLNKLWTMDYGLWTMELEPGIYYRDGKQIKNSGRFRLNHDLDSLPLIDRALTQWQLYAYNNGNYKRTPGTYIMSARDCWYHQCTFCSWPTLYPEFRARSTAHVLDEIEALIQDYKIREVMDDSGCFPAGDWLRDFCLGAISRKINQKIYLDCNMRFGALSAQDFLLMKKANFRLLLFGLESANQKTLDRLNKGLKVEKVIEDCKNASRAGLFPHITVMFGYPWEEYDDALKTLKLGRWLLKKGYAYTMQATLVIPYPGSKLFEECVENHWLKTMDWNDYDMKQPAMQSAIPDSKIMGLIQGMYRIGFSPEFILRKIFSLKDLDDLRYYCRAARKVAGHLFDFRKR